MESSIFFLFSFQRAYLLFKSLEIARRYMDAMKKEHFCPLKKSALKETEQIYINIEIEFNEAI